MGAIALSLAVAGAAQLPYLVAGRLAGEGSVFAGFLINPIDGFSYLAKMRQGAEGGWLLHLPYAAEPGPGAFLYVYYLALGHLATALGAPLAGVYLTARFAGAVLMYVVGFLFLRRALGPEGPVWRAYLLTLIASGLGWLVTPLGLVTPDLWMPEVIPFLSAYGNAHFPLACAALLAAVVAVMGGGRGREVRRFAIAVVAGAVLGAVLPFVVLSLGGVLILWLAWEKARGESIRARAIPFVGAIAGAMPWLIYDLWVSRIQPALAGWTAQNQTPSPPPLEFSLGYGLILLLALIGIARARPQSTPQGRLLVTWLVVNAVLLYAPIDLQRRLSLGLFFPLAALAALGLQSLGRGARLQRTAFLAVLILSVPSNLLVIGAGLAGVARDEPSLVMTEGEAAAYTWAAANLPRGSLVLAGPTTGNRLPAFADLRVVYGHPFETPDAEARLDLVERLFAGAVPRTEALRTLAELGVSYAFFGPEEQALGSPSWLDGRDPVHRSGGVDIYRMTGP